MTTTMKRRTAAVESSNVPPDQAEALEIRPTNVPTYVMQALIQARSSRNYSRLKHVFHCIWLHGAAHIPDAFTCVGVVGDGDNGAYEMFKWRRGVFEISDDGYGCVETALLRVLASEASL